MVHHLIPLLINWKTKKNLKLNPHCQFVCQCHQISKLIYFDLLYKKSEMDDLFISITLKEKADLVRGGGRSRGDNHHPHVKCIRILAVT